MVHLNIWKLCFQGEVLASLNTKLHLGRRDHPSCHCQHVSNHPVDNFSILWCKCTYATEILLNEGFSIGVGLLTIPWDVGWRQVISEDVCMWRERPQVQSLCQHSNPESKGVVNAGDLQTPFSPLPAQSIILAWSVQVPLYSWVRTGQGGVTADGGMSWLSWVCAKQLHNTRATLQDQITHHQWEACTHKENDAKVSVYVWCLQPPEYFWQSDL